MNKRSRSREKNLLFEFFQTLFIAAFHDFEGSASDLAHVTQHEHTHVGQAIAMPMINGSLVTQFADVDLRWKETECILY